MATTTAKPAGIEDGGLKAVLTQEDRRALLRYMLLMRATEERALTLYRQGIRPAAAKFPPVDSGEILVDRVATVLLLLATVGLLVAGLGNRKVVVADTNDEKKAVEAAQGYVLAHAPADVRHAVIP